MWKGGEEKGSKAFLDASDTAIRVRPQPSHDLLLYIAKPLLNSSHALHLSPYPFVSSINTPSYP